VTAGGQAGAGTQRGRGRSGSHRHRHSQDWACKGLKSKQGSLGRSRGAQAGKGRGFEPRGEGGGLAPRLAGVLTIQSGHDGLAQREHQPQRGAKEEEAGYLKVEAGAGAFRPVQRRGAAPRCLRLQRGLAGLQAGTAGPVGTGTEGFVPLPPAWGAKLCPARPP